MKNDNMAKFILEKRKQNNLTQKQLAVKLNISDKTVSKWERGMGYPDISLLVPLAEALGVTANDLLNGEERDASPIESDKIIESTVQYVNKLKLHKKKSVKDIIKMAISAACFLGLLTCTICDLAISGSFTWSLYPIISIIYVWLITMPLFQFEKNSVMISLAAISVLTIPYLYLLDKIVGVQKLILPIGIRVSVVGIIYLWVVYLLLSTKKAAKWYMAAISALLGIPVCLMINYILQRIIHEPLIDVWDIVTFGILGIVAFMLFSIGNERKAKGL
jgi:transcriptional regulator with XRE-family HTH domain